MVSIHFIIVEKYKASLCIVREYTGWQNEEI